MVGFFGWTAERGRDGSWFATGIVRSRHLLADVSKAADKEAAMREIKRLYVIGALQ